VIAHLTSLFPSHTHSWILFDEKNFEGDQHILSEGEFPTLTAMGCLASTVLGSLRKVPLVSAPFQATLEAEGVLLGESWAQNPVSVLGGLMRVDCRLLQDCPRYP
jgi:hypothetical protein